MDTLPLQGLPRRLFGVSASSLGAWLDCPRKYRFSYVDRPAPPRGGAFAHSSLGASVHNALRDWWLAPRARRTPEAAATTLDLAWIADGYRTPDHSASWRDRARSWVERYVSGLDPDDEPRWAEHNVTAPYGSTLLKGRVDRLDERDGELVVVDYKTGRRGVSADEARGSWALAIYAYAVERTLRRPCRRVELHHVPTGEVVTHELTEESLRRQLDRITEATEEVRAAVEADPRDLDALFPPRPSPGCGWCDFHRSCPAGQAAAAARLPWDGLADAPAPPATDLPTPSPAPHPPAPAASAGPPAAPAAPAPPAAPAAPAPPAAPAALPPAPAPHPLVAALPLGLPP